MSGTIIEDENQSVNFAALGLGNQDRLEEGCKVEEAFARMALAIDNPISNT